MAKLQQLLVLAIIGTMAFGGVACLCPAEAGAAAAPAENHSHHHDASADSAKQPAACGHENCEGDCGRISAVASKEAATFTGKPAFQLDDLGLPPSASFVLAPLPDDGITTELSSPRASLPGETPVQRCDRLLD